MDLVAYSQIEDLAQIAALNGIDVPRLRGYRLMKDEKALTQEELKELFDDAKKDTWKSVMHNDPPFSAHSLCTSYDDATDRRERKYLISEKEKITLENGESYVSHSIVGVRWDRLHGKKRKNMKFAIKQAIKRADRQYTVWNKFAGQDDVLYIHSRIGRDFDGLRNEPWFLGGVVDWYDETYCDIYAKITKWPNGESEVVTHDCG